MKRYSTWVLLGVMAICVYLMNFFSIPAHDELAYAYLGQSTPIEGDVNRIASLADVFWQQYGDYFGGGNGRVFVHGLCAILTSLRLNAIFDVINTVMWFLLIGLILSEGQVRVFVSRTYLIGATCVWWVLWYCETCCINMCYAIDFLWMACATIGIMKLWRNLRSWWMLPLFFLYGWSFDLWVLPMIVALFMCAIIRSFIEKHFVLSIKQCVAWILMVVGAYFLCASPASHVRVGRTFSEGLSGFILDVVKGNLGLFMLVTPIIMFAMLIFILWMKRRTVFPVVYRSLDWWLYFGASYGLFCLVSRNGIVRIAMPMMLAGLILILRERDVFSKYKSALKLKSCLSFVFCWMIGAVVLQGVLYCEIRNMLNEYKNNEQGITYRKAISSGPMYYTVTNFAYNDWNIHFFRREFGLKNNPTTFTPWLYDTLYLSPELFFASAKELGDSGLFVSPKCPKAVVTHGHTPLNENQKMMLDSYFKTLNETERGWRRFLPGRLYTLFPDDDFYLNIVDSDRFAFVAVDNKPYTLYLMPER